MSTRSVRRRRSVVACFLFLLACWMGSFQSASALVQAPQPWRIVPSMTPGTEAALYGTAALATGEAWAVGTTATTFGQKALIERWDGTRFMPVTTPNVPNTPNILRSVSASSPSDAWVVGDTGSIQGTRTLTEHWNGTRWQIVPSPNLGLYNYLNAVTAISAENAWAVGRADLQNGTVSTLIEHWDGTNWQVVPSPNVTDWNELFAVTVVSARNIWAAGSSITFRQDGAVINQTLIEHWNGSVWQVVPSPNVENVSNNLLGITAVSARDLWAVGNLYNPTGGPGGVLIEHWNGSQWQLVKSPALPADGGLNAVVAISSHTIWAVGSYTNDRSQTVALLAHWDGSQWQRVTSPNPAPYTHLYCILWAVAADQTGRVVAVGVYSANFGPSRTLVELQGA